MRPNWNPSRPAELIVREIIRTHSSDQPLGIHVAAEPLERIILAVDRLRVLGNGLLAAASPSERVELVVWRKDRARVFHAHVAQGPAIVIRVGPAVDTVRIADQAFNIESTGCVLASVRGADSGATRDIAADIDRRFAEHDQSAPIAAGPLAERL